MATVPTTNDENLSPIVHTVVTTAADHKGARSRLARRKHRNNLSYFLGFNNEVLTLYHNSPTTQQQGTTFDAPSRLSRKSPPLGRDVHDRLIYFTLSRSKYELLPLDIAILVALQSHTEDIAALGRYYKAYHALPTSMLYSRNVQFKDYLCVLFATRDITDENRSILIIQNAMRARDDVEVQDLVTLYNAFPRRHRHESPNSNTTYRPYHSTALAMAISRCLNKVVDFLWRKSGASSTAN
ncbi:hypothetical protein BJ170DRAFT_594120 [Xylariales sp. AK1849]|nr:hypothetical protein BJ170DRAFT_594120 [Xylariales sp. AK1849]